jgi:hypothetical protein
MNTVTCSIVIRTAPNPDGKIVQAEVAWPLAVHPASPGDATGSWTVTHIPSGLAVLHGRDRDHAIELVAQCFDAALPEEWIHCHHHAGAAVTDFVRRMRLKMHRPQEV